MKKRAVVLSILLAASLFVTGCSWSEVRSKFTGEDVDGGAGSGTEETVIAEYVASEYVTVPEYKGIEVDCTVSEEDLQAEIDSFLGDAREEKQVKKGKCKENDTVNIDYEGKIDGEPFDNGSETGRTITLGSSGFIPGFDEGVIGMKVGETKDVPVTFPDDYHEESLKGKPAVFTITLNYISQTITPELSDKLVSEKTEYKTVEEYKKGTMESLKKKKKDDAGTTAYGQIDQEAEKLKDYPADLVKAYSTQIDNYYRGMASSYQMEFEAFLSQMAMDEATYQKYLDEAAQSSVKTQLLTEAIAEKEGITVTEEELKARIKEDVDASGKTEEDLRKSFQDYYGKDMPMDLYYRAFLLQNKVIEFIGQNAKIKE